MPVWMGSIIGIDSICTGTSITLYYPTTGGSWVSSNTSVSTVGSTSGLITGLASGFAAITYTLPCGCYTVQNIYVKALPIVSSITGSGSILIPGATTTFADSSTGGTWSSSNTAVATIGSTGIATGVSVGTNIISYTITNSCGPVSATYVLTVSSLTIGESYGGGVVAYILTLGDPGYDPAAMHGLIDAGYDLGATVRWGDGCCPLGVTTGATGTAIGTGLINTNRIVNALGYYSIWGDGYAAAVCRLYTGGGYVDWYLPSLGELNKLYLNKGLIGGFAFNFYWSSTEASATNAWLQYFIDGSTGNYNKNSTFDACRAVRSF
jgi:hypothetical protein